MSDTRKDAARNRARIVESARTLAASGAPIAFNAIARVADVGVGTVYRHFAAVEELEEAVALDRFQELAEILSEAGPNQLERALTAHFTLLTADALFEKVAARAAPALAETTAMRDELLQQLEQLMKRAVTQGHLRDDVDATTVLQVVCGFAYAARSAQIPAHSTQANALLRVMFDGLRPVAG